MRIFKHLLKSLAIGCALLFFGFLQPSLLAQKDVSGNPLYGPDTASRIECQSNLSTMSEFYKINMFDFAYDAWRACFNNCPKASKNIYVMGVRIVKNKIDKASNDIDKQYFVDTLMLLYDRRIQYFGQEGYVMGRKGIDLLRYKPSELEEAYSYLNKAASLEKQNTEEAVLVTLFQTTYVLYKNKQRTAEDFVNMYMQVSDLLSLSTSTDSATLKAATESVEKTFAESGAASQEMLENIFTPKYQANPNDLVLLKRITALFNQNNFTQSTLFAQASESLYKVEPSANAANNLARLFEVQGNAEKSIYYYNQAIELETDPIVKAGYYYRISVIFEQQGNHQVCRTNALKAIELNPAFGDPYIIIGLAYAMSSANCGTNAFERGTVFWAATDMFSRAKSVDPALTDKANEYIGKYAAYYPTKEEAFFNGLTDGMSYTVGCWINEKTTVRSRK
jgi:tetratricopeptide (TPR) repeat protein